MRNGVQSVKSHVNTPNNCGENVQISIRKGQRKKENT